MKSLNQRRKHIFLSAHLDDAVFACGGLIAKAGYAGCPVEVVTFYTKQVDPKTLPRQQAKAAIYDRRKEEDRAALEVLGATPTWADFTERFIRPPWLPSPLHVFRTPLYGSMYDFDNAAAIERYISELISDNPEARFFVSLGVGNHYDHVELFLFSVKTAIDLGQLHRFAFYEEGYAMGTRMRKRHYVARKACWRWWEAPASRSLKWLIMSNIMASQARGRPVYEYLPEKYRNVQWTVKPELIKGYEGMKLTSMSKYKSQYEMLGGDRMFGRILKQYHKYWGGAEPYWYVQM
jgi:LmbE family N-acetylglucosaminyl deacetylase